MAIVWGTAVSCPDDCGELELPLVNFNLCSPEANPAQIEWIYLALPGTVLPVDAAAMALAMVATDATAVRKLHVIGSKPAPTSTKQEISGGRFINVTKKHVLNFTIDETNVTNLTFLQTLECNPSLQFWYETSGGKLFGGSAGIQALADINMVIDADRNALIKFEGSLTWDAPHTEQMVASPYN